MRLFNQYISRNRLAEKNDDSWVFNESDRLSKLLEFSCDEKKIKAFFLIQSNESIFVFFFLPHPYVLCSYIILDSFHTNLNLFTLSPILQQISETSIISVLSSYSNAFSLSLAFSTEISASSLIRLEANER